MSTYSGGNWFSNIVYNKIVVPIRDKFHELSELIYRKLIGDPAFQNIGRLMLTLYIE